MFFDKDYVVFFEITNCLNKFILKKNQLKSLFIITIATVSFFLLLGEPIFAEAESFTVAARDYERVSIPLKQGDEITYSVTVSGGINDDIDFTIYYPGGINDGGGTVYEQFSDKLVAQSSGNYIFEFDNTDSLISNKFVEFSYDITKNTYYVYIDPLPEWADYATNVLFEATEFWIANNPNLNFFVANSPNEADFTVKWVKDFGQEHVGYAYGDMFIEVGLGDSNCGGKWNPYSGRHVSKIMKHEIGHILGFGHSSDPDDIMFEYASQTEYGSVKNEFTLRERTGQYVDLCTGKQVTAFEYSVVTDDPEYGFDVYVVPTPESLELWSQQESFPYYPEELCSAEGFLSFVGECNGVSSSSGLLIIMDTKTTNSLTNIKVAIQEKPYNGGPQKTSAVSNVYEVPRSELLPNPEGIPRDIFEEQQSQSNKISCGEGTVLVGDKCISQNQNDEGGGCLIATATYGSELAPQVQLLREIRDNTLLQTYSGYSFMTMFNQFYYSFSPTIADLERQNPMFKEVVKITITPMLSTLSILNYIDIDSEQEMLGFGVGMILLNLGMYFVVPAIIILKIRSKFSWVCTNLKFPCLGNPV